MLTLICRPCPFKGWGKQLQFKKVQFCYRARALLVTSLPCLSPAGLIPWLVGIRVFGAGTGVTLRMCHSEAVHAGCVLLSAEPVTPQWSFVWGNPTGSLCQSQLYMCAVESPLPLTKRECQSLKQLFLLSYRQHCLFHPTKSCYSLIHFSLSLTARSINYFSAKILEGFLPLPHFLKSLHTE